MISPRNSTFARTMSRRSLPQPKPAAKAVVVERHHHLAVLGERRKEFLQFFFRLACHEQRHGRPEGERMRRRTAWVTREGTSMKTFPETLP
jgi:hypothetical protein